MTLAPGDTRRDTKSLPVPDKKLKAQTGFEKKKGATGFRLNKYFSYTEEIRLLKLKVQVILKHF